MRSQEIIKYEKWRTLGRLSIFSSRIFRFVFDNEKKKCYRIICLKNNGHQGLKSDKISFRVDHTTILYSDANWGRKVKTKLSDFKRGLATL